MVEDEHPPTPRDVFTEQLAERFRRQTGYEIGRAIPALHFDVGAVSEPRRPLAIDLPSPYLTCFDEVFEVAYDIKPASARRVGWYRFVAPPGLRQLELNSTATGLGSSATHCDGCRGYWPQLPNLTYYRRMG